MVFKNIPRKQIIIDAICMILWSIINVIYIRMLSKLISNFSDTNPAITVVIGYFIFLLIWELVEYVGDRNQELSYSYIENNVRSQVIDETYKLKPEIIKKFNTGYINGVVNKYIQHKTILYNCIILYAPLSAIYVGYSIYMMWSFHFSYGLALAILIAGSFVIKLVFTSVEDSKRLTESESNRDKIVIDSISNINTIQKMQCKDFIQSKISVINNECLINTNKWTKKNETSYVAYKLLMYSYLPIVLFIWYLFPNTISNKTEFFSFLSIICVQIVHTAQSLSQTLVNAIKYKASLKKLKEIYNPVNVRYNLIANNDFRTAQIIDLTYEYLNENIEKTVKIQIPFFQLNKGDKICIYGESGQGKSTLLNLLSSEIETGKILINGRKENKRLDCVFIAQDTEILDMSLRDNLTLGHNILDIEIISLIRKCGLGEWFDKQSNGLDTILGERGVFVSTGQRQRLNIIRGLLIKDKEIYLLDEPTSNVDDDTEEKIIKVIEEYLKDKTIVIVTHRPKIKEICTKAYKFTNGILGKKEILKTNL